MGTIALFLTIVGIFLSGIFALLSASKEREEDAQRAYKALRDQTEGRECQTTANTQ